MEYIRVENNAVVELVSCSERPSPEWQEVNLDGGLAVGDDVRAFDANWEPVPVPELLAAGVLSLAVASENDEVFPTGTVLEKIHGEQIVKKTKYDFIKEGVFELGPLEYLDEETKTVRTANSVTELLALGQITEDRANEMLAEKARSARDQLLKQTVDPIVTNPLRWGAMGDDLKKAYAEYRQALLDIPQQDTFPKNINWPTPPE